MKNLKLKNIKQIGHQGDTQWYSIDEIPDNAIKTDKQFIAESERSGSFHALFGNYDMYEVENGFVLDVKEDCILNHSLKEHLTGKSMDDLITLPKKDHRASTIIKGKYFVGIQQRFDPMSGYKEKVLD